MDYEQKRALKTRLLKQFSGQSIPWEPLVQRAAAEGADRDSVLECMNELISENLIAIPRPDVYSLPGTIKRAEGQFTMSRADFDCLIPQGKMDYTNAGGILV